MQLKDCKFYYKTLDSTQDEAWKKVLNGTEKGIVISNIQTKGRGTHGRTWFTDEENNIAFSIFVSLNCNIKKLENITIKIAEVIVDILNKNYQIKLDIKKPNDIVFKGKKIGGILTEIKSINETVKFLVVGIGLNTNKVFFNEEIKNIATSIKKEFGISIETNEFIDEFCNRFENEITRSLV